MDAQIQAYIRRAASRARDTEQIGPFLATFTLGSSNPYLNYAIPDAGANPSPDDVAALIDAFRRRNLKPRLEYVAKLAPEVEAALTRASFTVDDRLPIMVCAPGDEREVPAPEGFEILAPEDDDELYGMAAAQSEAYGDGVPAPSSVESQRAFLAAGGIAVLARDVATGESAGGAICDVPFDGISELAGVGVRPSFRGRGIAAAMTAHLAHAAFARGITTLFLMPGDGAAERIYKRAGFRTTDLQVIFMSLDSSQVDEPGKPEEK